MENSFSNQIIKNLSLLKEAQEKGIIDLDRLNAELNVVKEKEYLEKHTSKIWQGKNEYWYTRIDGKLIKKRRKEDLDALIIEHYKSLDPSDEPTFKSTYDEWLSSKLDFREVKESSILRYMDDYKRYFEGGEFEKVLMKDINDVVLDVFVRSTIANYELTAKAYACFRTIIIGVLKYAKRMGYTSFSVGTFFKDFQISKSAFKKGSTKKGLVYQKQERESLYDYLMKNPTIENLGLALMCLTGLRIGELSSIKPEDNIKSCVLYIHRTETRVREGKKTVIVVQDTAKMGHDDTIVIPNVAQRIVDISKYKSAGDEYLFSIKGRRITAQTFRRHLKKACKELEIDYRPPHQMRKTFASILLASGIDEAIVKKEMRHTDIATTRSYYQYITDSEDKEKAIIDSVIGL